MMTATLYNNAMIGSLVADAVAMPVHWYYDTAALDRDYPDLHDFQAPRNPHPDSILWRSRYAPRNQQGDILHDQAKYWGQRGVHYHQFLAAGENTLNFKLAAELYQLVINQGTYCADAWLQHYAACMLQDGWHHDTYAEEYHRAFFDHYAQGKPLAACGIDDVHIGGLSQVPSLLAALHAIGLQELDEQLTIVEQHIRLTHLNQHVVNAGIALSRILHALSQGSCLRESIETGSGASWKRGQFDTWSNFPDRTVVGRQLSTACYLPEAFTASLYLCWKYAANFRDGILANARCGGDNCHRGAVVGALLGAANSIPQPWLDGLHALHTGRLDGSRCK
jgi:ADP-ribosyl-[dinitrogen reductase] hydrolase